jgi:hypothetical protein
MEPNAQRSSLLSRRIRPLGFGAAAVFFCALPAFAQPAGIEPVSLVGVRNGLLEKAATGAITLALEKLARPNCQKVLTDFHDVAGVPLQAKLEATGYSAPDFLEILRFANGERLTHCQSRRVLAATAPNSHVIYLCGLQFFERQRVSPEFSAALVIHEMLHSLGLGENPPSSNDITARVLERCGG